MIASTTSDLLQSLLPFVLLFGFWVFLMRTVRIGKGQNPMLDKLEEIRAELERIRRAVERDPFSH